jgi:subfamily B ATP-binding cassette protein HlyB/CyaB
MSHTAQAIHCLVLLAKFHGVQLDPERLAKAEECFDLGAFLAAVKMAGLHGAHTRCSLEQLVQQPLPAIALAVDGGWFIVGSATHDQVLVHDPLTLASEHLDYPTLQTRWSGELVLVQSQASLLGDLARFDFSWFIPAIIRYRHLLGQVLLAAFALQLLALVTPLMFQVVMDKVLVHQAFNTLDVLVFSLIVIMFAESLLSGIRTYVFAHTAARIDVQLGSRLFNHLTELPLAYFQARRVGDSVARVRELESIREFLTGNSITLLLDVLFTMVFVAVMFSYSNMLTWLVLASLPVYFLLSWYLTAPLQARVQESFSRSAEQQAFLLETVRGIDTLKSMALEPHVIKRWNGQLAGYVGAHFRTQNLAAMANEGVGLIGKLTSVVLLWLGARLVIEGQLTVGQFIAFNMLAGRLAQPIQRLAQLWTGFQQTGIAMQRLADILNARSEADKSDLPAMPTIRGAVRFEDVCFRYQSGAAMALDGFNLHIKAGEMIGVVGRSGCGKSTVARVLQRLHVQERGRVLIDGIDTDEVETASLRRQIGVVQQDNLLFQCSVRDNIAFTDRGAPIAEIVAAAQVAGAHEFILQLPQGYDTPVDEHGASLSGGQRQRLAIARALMGNPRILVFDEATSALDYESERVIQANMAKIRADRTVIIIAHRLNAVRHADRIVVMEAGRVAEIGTHEALLALGGIYAQLTGEQIIEH